MSAFRRTATLLFGAGLLVGVLATALPAHAAAPVVTGTVVTGGGSLNLRATASAGAAVRGSAANGAKVTISCRVSGQTVTGRVRTTPWWDRVTGGAYVSDGYISRGAATPGICTPTVGGSPAPVTTSPAPIPIPVGGVWIVPVTAQVGDGFRPPGRPTHQGVDLRAARNSAIHAASAGTVITAKCNASTNNCDIDGGLNVTGCGWYVEIAHPDKVVTRYCHLGHVPLVKVGQKVTLGQLLGYVGASGHASGPHLHFEVHVGAPPTSSANAVDPVTFMKAQHAPLGIK